MPVFCSRHIGCDLCPDYSLQRLYCRGVVCKNHPGIFKAGKALTSVSQSIFESVLNIKKAMGEYSKELRSGIVYEIYCIYLK